MEYQEKENDGDYERRLGGITKSCDRMGGPFLCTVTSDVMLNLCMKLEKKYRLKIGT